MSPADLKRLYPNASASTIRANEALEQLDHDAATHGKPVVELGSTKPQHREVQTLASCPPKQTKRAAGVCSCCVLIVRYGKRRLDDDNLTAAYKALRDAIAATLGIDDGDPRIKFEYSQVKSRARGTHVVISH